MTLTQAAEAVNGTLVGDDVSFAGVSTDTRTLAGRPLFVALRGENFDGHDYLTKAAENGAVAALVERISDVAIPQLLVDDTRLGLGRLAAAWRRQSDTTVIAVTGSNGKTTLKEMIRSILLQQEKAVLATAGNLNNDIGLPLTLLRLQDEPRAVVEMGANHAGEIAYLSEIAQPDVAVLNNAGRAHLEGFGSPEGVARAKAEIISGLKEGGCFIYNADSPWAGLWRELAANIKTIGFGSTADADVHSTGASGGMEWTESGFVNRFSVQTPVGEFEAELKLAGDHNLMNALAASAVAVSIGVELEDVKKGLATLEPVKGRLHVIKVNDIYLVDDSYNANPDSVEAAMEGLRSGPGRHFLVLGDLAELGETAVELHRSLGDKARRMGIDYLYAMGELSAATVEGFGAAGRHFSNHESLLETLLKELEGECVVLIKGSRSAGMERIVEGIINKGGG